MMLNEGIVGCKSLVHVTLRLISLTEVFRKTIYGKCDVSVQLMTFYMYAIKPFRKYYSCGLMYRLFKSICVN